jgi:D-arabinose 1-dehydrogenase-like Zn-dependent alcohol dehydrogenase
MALRRERYLYEIFKNRGQALKAVVWTGAEKMAIKEVPEPPVAPGAVILHPEASGICGS